MSSSTAAAATGATAGGSGVRTSMVSAEEATGWHVMKVKGCSQYRAAAAFGKIVTSGAFTVGRHSWRVLYFPNGNPAKQNAPWVGFGLRAVDSGGGGGRVRFTLRLLDEEGAPLSPSTWSYTPVSRQLGCSGRGTDEWYFGQFIRSEGFNSLCHKADCFCVRCDVTVVLETTRGDDDSVEPPPELHLKLGSILARGVGGDVTFEVGKETLVAHKNMLAARSPVFMKEFFGYNSVEKKVATTASRVQIHGIDARAFKAMLYFIYTDSLPPEIDEGDQMFMARHLLMAAGRYDLQRLKMICENKLCILVNASAVVTTLVLAEQHGCPRLKDACFKVLKEGDNFKALGYDDYNSLLRGCPSVLNKLIAEQGL